MKLVKLLKEKSEEARISIRKIRDDARGKITNAEKNSEISEDEKYRLHEDLDKLAARFNEKIRLFSLIKNRPMNGLIFYVCPSQRTIPH